MCEKKLLGISQYNPLTGKYEYTSLAKGSPEDEEFHAKFVDSLNNKHHKFRFNKTEEALQEIDPITKWRNMSNTLADNLQKAEQQILNKRVDRVNNILYILLVLLYAIAVGIVLKYC